MPSWKCRKLQSIAAGQISRNRFVDVQVGQLGHGALSTAGMQSWRGRELPSRSGLQAV